MPLWLPSLVLSLLASVTPIPIRVQKITSEEIVARHLASIGPDKARAAVRALSFQIMFTNRVGTIVSHCWRLPRKPLLVN